MDYYRIKKSNYTLCVPKELKFENAFKTDNSIISHWLSQDRKKNEIYIQIRWLRRVENILEKAKHTISVYKVCVTSWKLFMERKKLETSRVKRTSPSMLKFLVFITDIVYNVLRIP